MTADLIFPLIGLVGWLIVAGGALASYRLGWGKMVKMALVWTAIFAGAFLLVSLLTGMQ